jgi:diguanylate cyclase (GGDEF)-like protein
MDEKMQIRDTEGDLSLIQNLVTRFPMSCVCFQPVFDACGIIENLFIYLVNAGFETIIGIPRGTMMGKTVADVFGVMRAECVVDILKRINDAYRSESKTCEVKARILGQIYKVSFLFLGDKLLLAIFEDIHAKYFRKYYHRSIPRDVVTASITKGQLPVPQGGSPLDAPDGAVGILKQPQHDNWLEPLVILPNETDFAESYDTVFRDSLTGLYDRVFAMEALRMYMDNGVRPLSIALGDVNGLRMINETLGFRAGDDILVKIAGILEENCRSDDVVARWNDGQFVLLLPRASQSVAQQIIKRLHVKFDAICKDAYNIVTFGYATCEDENTTAENLIQEAEKWIYQKKLLINQSHRSSMIRLLISMLQEKSAETQEHSDRMAEHCRWIAKKLRLSDEMIDDLVLLSMLHDIGKIGIPDTILNKPGPLTAEERLIINQHPEIGYRIAQTVPELRHVAAFILTHHERWDGKGYPKGLRGEEIPIASRIIAMVDTYDVIVTGRAYQPARSKEEAIAELQRCAGTQFDPDLVAMYVQLLEQQEP